MATCAANASMGHHERKNYCGNLLWQSCLTLLDSDAPSAWVNAVDAKAMDRVLYYMDNLKVLTRSNVGFPLEININNNKKYQDSYA